MATRSTIAIKRTNGTFAQIYCHYDGYDAGVGQTLRDYYDSTERVEELMALGDISYLESLLTPPAGSDHSFSNPVKGVTVAYGRDRGEQGCKVREFVNESTFTRFRQLEEYNYLFDAATGRWTC
jgi:hypothetical protein